MKSDIAALTYDMPIPTPDGESDPASERRSTALEPDAVQLRLNALFHRRPETRWSDRELIAFRKLGDIAEEDLVLLENYYRASIPQATDYRRRDLHTLLNNLRGEVDRARNFKPASNPCF